ncbi:tyrosine recombinase XerC [Cohnella sp. GCM10012308]|uniref:site-specific integrase n=1 Tax=Cohnella sp. GCM10012308 TaxID=3317329 RepID=UPI00360E7D66
MSSWRKRGENSYLLILEYGRDAAGNRIQPTKTIRVTDPALLRAPKRLEAHLQHELSLFKLEYESGSKHKDARVSFKQFTDEWLVKHVDTLEAKTQTNYRLQLKNRILPFFERMWLEDVNTRKVNDFLVHLRSPAARRDGMGPLKSATIVYNYRVLKSIFRLALEEGYIETNPMTGVRKPKEDDLKEMEVYDENEIKQLFAALEDEPPHIRLMVLLAVTTGMRRGEMTGLEWSRVNLEEGYLRVEQSITKTVNSKPLIKGPKNKTSYRRITLPEAIVEELREYKVENVRTWEGHDFVFNHADGKPLHPNRLTKWWIDFHRRHGLKPIRLHDLRHTSVSWMIYKKIHPEAIARRTGHKNSKMQEIYGHIFKSVEQETAAAFNDMMKRPEPETVHELSTDCPPNSQNDPKNSPTIH